MSKKLLVSLIVIAAGIGIGLYLIPYSAGEPSGGGEATFPDGGDTDGRTYEENTTSSSVASFKENDSLIYDRAFMTTRGKNGQFIRMENIRSAETVDNQNREIFRFGQHRDDSDRLYELTYFAEYDAFQIDLLRRPLAPARQQAEFELMNQLDIDPETLCNLRLFVRTEIPPHQNKELGLETCSTALPLTQ
jgi:hypothetical protein